MRETIGQLLNDLQQGRPCCYCRLVETRGSTPQKAGAIMLVYADGSQAGTLGGGCVEAEVKRRALAVLQAGQGEVVRFQLDSDYGWDDGLICGGRMQVLIEPLRQGSRGVDYFQQLGAAIEAGQGIAEVIVYDREASGLEAPQSFLFDEHAELRASLTENGLAEKEQAEKGAGAIPEQVRASLQPLSGRPRARAERGVAFLPVLPRCPLLIVGGGHVGQAVANLAATLDFDVIVVDDREDIISPERFPAARKRIAGSVDSVLPELEITPDTYCLIVTRGHNHDEEALYYLAERGARYVGLIGSRRKIKMIFEDLIEQGIAAASLEQVYAPVGVDIGSQTVPEIAVSICSELVAHRNRDGVIPGRPAAVVAGHAET